MFPPVKSWIFELMVVMMVGLFFFGCKKDESITWTEVLDNLQSDTALFSFMFLNPPPEGTLLKISVFDVDCEVPCALFTGESGCSERDLWVLHANIGAQTPGSYPIVASFDGFTDRNKASVELVHVNGLEQTKQFQAVAGSVEIVEAPYDAAEWNAGQNLTGRIRAEFPSRVLHQIECRDIAQFDDAGTAIVTSECTCEDEDGNQSICIPESANGNCCYDLSSPPVLFEMDIQASQCKGACSTAPELFVFCLELQ